MNKHSVEKVIAEEVSNSQHKHLIKLSDKKGCDCVFQKTGKYVEFVSNTSCAMCFGEDPYGNQKFCPVCEYCCGC